MKSFLTLPLLLTAFCLAPPVWAGESMLPDPRLTPGKVARGRMDHQGVTEEMERKVFRLYQIPWRRRAEFKIDHLIPVELGGADCIENLWPQSLSVKPYGAVRKELLSQRLVRLVKERKITLAEAQAAISKDWISSFIDQFGIVYLQ